MVEMVVIVVEKWWRVRCFCAVHPTVALAGLDKTPEMPTEKLMG